MASRCSLGCDWTAHARDRESGKSVSIYSEWGKVGFAFDEPVSSSGEYEKSPVLNRVFEIDFALDLGGASHEYFMRFANGLLRKRLRDERAA